MQLLVHTVNKYKTMELSSDNIDEINKHLKDKVNLANTL